MFGTELDTAYFEPTLNTARSETISNPQTETISKRSPPQITQEELKYPPIQTDQSRFISEESIELSSIAELKKQLKLQKDLNMMIIQKDTENMYDRFISKKKDVMKLLCLSLTVLLAISIHFVLSDLIKNYIMNNNFSENKETFVKIMYPLSVFIIVWSMKVFNK
jgi:hypothetical protein